jgi:hypothetical protein
MPSLDEATHALIRAFAACRVAMDALAELPQDVRAEVEEPLRAFCDVVGPALLSRYPEFFDGSSSATAE